MYSNCTIRTNDGVRIWTRCYLPENKNNKVIVVAPGVGLTLEYYHLFASFLRQHGYAVVTFDYRGVGKSAPQKLKGFEANMHQWAVQDINAVLLHAKQNFAGHEIIYVGHCIGGEIIGLAPASQYIHRIVLVSSALSCARLWPAKDKIKIRMLKASVSLLNNVFGYFPGERLSIFGDLPRGVIHEWANWCDNQNGLFDSFPDNNYRKLHVPVIAYSFSDDWHCPPRAVKELLNRFANATITWYHIKPKEIGMKKVGHNDFFSLALKPVMWENLLQWTNTELISNTDPKPLTIKRF